MRSWEHRQYGAKIRELKRRQDSGSPALSMNGAADQSPRIAFLRDLPNFMKWFLEMGRTWDMVLTLLGGVLCGGGPPSPWWSMA